MKAADEPLGRYRAMRDFDATPEPSGGRLPPRPGAAVAANGRRRFLVQRHRATRLHYDLRLELDGVLLSWAVPKGPTLDAKARRLAVQVEDHPFDYGWFEGMIPSGYGMGDVIVWDDGWWEPEEAGVDVRKALDAGELKFVLHGHKLHGRFVLIRTTGQAKGRAAGADDGRSWLVMHRRDDDAVAGWDAEDHPLSVLSGRTNVDVERGSPASWAAPTADELAGLDTLGVKGTWTIGGIDVPLTNLDKVLIDASARGLAVTKRDIVRHYALMAPWLAPYLAGRPVNMNRFPDGLGRRGFWHKAVPEHAPDWVRRWPYLLAGEGETHEYVMFDGAASLAWAANFAAIEIHPWTSTAASPEEPSYALIDIDPGTATTWEETLTLARLFRTAVEHLELIARPKVTGKRGLQVWIPVRPGYSFSETHHVVETLSKMIGATVPDWVSWRWNKGERGGKARLDHTQNAVNKTLVAPYSLRAEPGAPVSVPIEWDELDDPGLRPDRWTIADVGARLAEHGDPFRAIVGVRQDLPEL